ncbi:MAG: hypothetical protein R2855_10025 [Thermomicrobiales bacterium]
MVIVLEDLTLGELTKPLELLRLFARQLALPILLLTYRSTDVTRACASRASADSGA